MIDIQQTPRLENMLVGFRERVGYLRMRESQWAPFKLHGSRRRHSRQRVLQDFEKSSPLFGDLV